jgi:DNA-binding Lrp family transcriptional regulator
MQNDVVFESTKQFEQYDNRALNNYQRNFPLVTRPFAIIGDQLGLSEQQCIRIFLKLKEENKISRIGPVFKPNTLGVSTLAAMQVPPERMTEVANFVNSMPEVNHNYERENDINLWFVVTAADSQKLTAILSLIELHTQIKVYDLQLEEEFRIDLGFDLITGTDSGNPGETSKAWGADHLTENTPSDKTNLPMATPIFETSFIEKLIPEIERGISIGEQPYREIADRLSVPESEIFSAIQFLQNKGSIRRFGVVVRHRELGYTSNAMVVWDIPDELVSQIGRGIVENPAFQYVRLCYKRRRASPNWNFNFYCMIHGKSRSEVLSHIQHLVTAMSIQTLPQQILFSKICFKQKGARYSSFDREKSEKLLLNLLQEGIPVTDEPYREIAFQTGFTEEEILNLVERWLKDGTLSRFGPMYNVEKFGGEFTLVAMQVPGERFTEVNDLINSFTEVAHNYEREHQLNMWFVLATDETEQTVLILKQIEEKTGLKTFSLPKQEEFYLNLRFQA